MLRLPARCPRWRESSTTRLYEVHQLAISYGPSNGWGSPNGIVAGYGSVHSFARVVALLPIDFQWPSARRKAQAGTRNTSAGMNAVRSARWNAQDRSIR